MVKKITTKRINSHRYKDFYKTATNFNEGAKVANEFEYFNAAGVLIIHAAIALADAITIKLVSEKCSGENHYEVINLLEEIIPKNKQRDQAIKHFKNLIDHKNLVSYSGDVYYKRDIDKLFKHLNRFYSWADSILE